MAMHTLIHHSEIGNCCTQVIGCNNVQGNAALVNNDDRVRGVEKRYMKKHICDKIYDKFIAFVQTKSCVLDPIYTSFNMKH